MIAAAALRTSSLLATLNIADYGRFEKLAGLRLARVRA
jgi:predicted nucleic acid-binding protein